MDSFSCSFWGHRSENWTKTMLSTAEAKVLDNSATVVMALHKLIPQATVIQPQRCMFVVAQWVALLSESTYQQKRLGYFNHAKALCHSCCTGNNGHNSERELKTLS